MTQEREALSEWLDKTEWVQKTATGAELGLHRADVLRLRIEALQAELEAVGAGGVQPLRPAKAAPASVLNHGMAYPPEKLLAMADDEAGPYCTDQSYIYTRRRLLACWQALAAFPLEQIEDGIDLAALAPQQATPAVGASGFDHKTAADFLSGKTVSDEAMRKFVQASRAAHDDRAGLQATLQSVRNELASREAEIALLKTALMAAEAAPQQAAPAGEAGEMRWNQAPCVHCGRPEGQHFNGRCHHIQGKTRYAPAPHQAAPAEPVAWQSRCRPTWGGGRPWSPWELCAKEQAEDCWKVPLQHHWEYEARALYTSPQPGLVPLAAVLARVDACAGPGSAVRLALEREFGGRA